MASQAGANGEGPKTTNLAVHPRPGKVGFGANPGAPLPTANGRCPAQPRRSTYRSRLKTISRWIPRCVGVCERPLVQCVYLGASSSTDHLNRDRHPARVPNAGPVADNAGRESQERETLNGRCRPSIPSRQGLDWRAQRMHPHWITGASGDVPLSPALTSRHCRSRRL
jgi:hypothetical protein